MDNLIEDGDEDFLFAFHNLQDGLRGIFQHLADGTQFAFLGINHLETHNLMEIELLAAQFGQHFQRQIGRLPDQMLRRLNGLHVLNVNKEFIAAIGDFLHKKRCQHFVDFQKEMLHIKVCRRVVYLQFEGHLPFQAVRLDNLSQIKTIFLFHNNDLRHETSRRGTSS